MLTEQIVDTYEAEEMLWYESVNTEKKSIKTRIINIVNTAKDFFIGMQKHCESIESFVNEFTWEQIQEKFRQKLESNRPKEEYIHMNLELCTQDSESLVGYKSTEVQFVDGRGKNKKGGILMKFKDNPDCKIKQNRRKIPGSKPRSSPKPAYFKLKLVRLYAKAIKTVINPKNKVGNNQEIISEDPIEFLTDDFSEHTLRNIERLKDIPPQMTKTNKTNSWYRSLFKDDLVEAENFNYFLIKFFGNSIDCLQKKLGFRCCENEFHLEDCDDKWKELMKWVFTEFTGSTNFILNY